MGDRKMLIYSSKLGNSELLAHIHSLEGMHFNGTECNLLDASFEDINTVHVTPTEDEAHQQRGKRSATRGLQT